MKSKKHGRSRMSGKKDGRSKRVKNKRSKDGGQKRKHEDILTGSIKPKKKVTFSPNKSTVKYVPKFLKKEEYELSRKNWNDEDYFLPKKPVSGSLRYRGREGIKEPGLEEGEKFFNMGDDEDYDWSAYKISPYDKEDDKDDEDEEVNDRRDLAEVNSGKNFSELFKRAPGYGEKREYVDKANLLWFNRHGFFY